MLFIVSGCDYISYFSGYGKGAFLHSTSMLLLLLDEHSYGHLNDYSEETKSVGFLSFLRLIGCLYFKKYLSAIVSIKNIETPNQLLFSKCTGAAQAVV